MVRKKLYVCGIVQGVGFRPFVRKNAVETGLCGFIRNTSDGVELELEGEERDIDRFIIVLKTKAPALAKIENISEETIDDLANYTEFSILHSQRGKKRNTLVSPDVGICDDCRRELLDKSDRRYLYPFINCTNCGPRFTIISDLPYDRDKTSMAGFPMCADCSAEYEDISDRRYHAQPNCCPVCGPRLSFLDENGNHTKGSPIKNAVSLLNEGKILAVKGLGGFHLACTCENPATARLLRSRKHRDEKPFAVMCKSISAAEKLCFVSEDEKALLCSPARPIVLTKKRAPGLEHISENGYIGIMLPYTPVHCLLMEYFDILIMTSANLSDTPIIYKNSEAAEKLAGIADGYLMNDREIINRCDDSLMRVVNGREYPVRRSRGYAPAPIFLSEDFPPILACGAEQKASFGLTRGRSYFQSQHIGDLKNAETLENYEKQISHFENIFDITPKAIVCDAHPDYLSTAFAQSFAEKNGLPLYRVFHHHAHLCSCMADNNLDGRCIGVVWDGAGFGEDRTSWGGEFILGGYDGFRRLGTIRSIPLAGGDKAVKEIYRIGCALMLDAELENEIPFEQKNLSYVLQMLKSGINCPSSSGMGRLFDGVAAILRLKETASYEGQGAVLLESRAEESDESYSGCINVENGLLVFDHRSMVRCIWSDKKSGTAVSKIAAKFMNTLVNAALVICRRIRESTGENRVCLTGGVFQNIYLLKRLAKALESDGFNVYSHSRVPANDEGIALGQTMIAANRLKLEADSKLTFL